VRVHPILAALTRHKVPVVLLILQVALTVAVLSNSSFVLVDYVRKLSIQSGVAEQHIGVLKLMPCSGCQAADVNARVMQYLQDLPNVSGIGLVNTVPFGPREADLGVRLRQEEPKDMAGAHVFTLGPGAFESLGLDLVSGRSPTAEDFVESRSALPLAGTAYVTEALGTRLWPGRSPLGKVIYVGKSRFTVVGTVRHLLRPEFELQSSNQWDFSIAVPVAPGPGLRGNYVFRAPADELPSIMERIRKNFAGDVPGLAVDLQNTHSLPDLRASYLQGDISVASMLVSILFLTLVTTMLGIVGLSSYWVRRRRRQIGVRRALGATRADVAFYFFVENGFIMMIGSALGVACAYGLNLELMRHYSLERLPVLYFPVSFMLMLVAGQIAVLAPAVRASRVDPGEAIRGQ